MLIKLSDKATAVFFSYLQRLTGLCLRLHLARRLHVWFPRAGYRVSVDTLCVTTALAVALLSQFFARMLHAPDTTLVRSCRQ